MKKSLFASLLALGLLASCGGGEVTPAGSSAGAGASKSASVSSHEHVYVKDDAKKDVAPTCSTEGHTYTKCSVCGKEKDTKAAKLEHNYQADPAKTNVAATCGAEGHTYTKCTLCGDAKDTVVPATAHTFGAAAELVASAASAETTGTKQAECSACHKKDLVIDAMDWTKMEGSNKDTTGATLKFAKNDDYAEYTINVPAAMTNAKVYLYGMVDYYYASSNQNENQSFFPNSAATANFELKLGTTAVEVTNKATYGEMFGGEAGKGETFNLDGKGDCEYSKMGLCEVGTVASIAAGELKITYTRKASYNLNITQIHIVA